MFQRLVAAVDGSEGSRRALEQAIVLADRSGAALDVVSIAEEPPRYISKQAEIEKERSEAERYFGQLHAEATLLAAQHGVSITTRVLHGHEARTLLDYARERHADLVVIGAQGHSAVWGALLGGTADQIVAHAPCSVLVVRPAAATRAIKEIVVGLDGSPLSDHALSVTLEFARLCGGMIHAVSAIAGDAGSSTARSWAAHLRSVDARARAAADLAGVRLESVTRQGGATRALVGYAREVDADLIVVGATGQEHPWNPTAGDTARHVANEAPCAVLLVRPPLAARGVGDVMARHVTAVNPDTPLPDAIDQLIRRGIKALPVVDAQGRVVGIVTGGDLLRRGGLGARLSVRGDWTPGDLAVGAGFKPAPTQPSVAGQTVRDVMTPNPRTVAADAPLEAAIHTLVRYGIKRLPVVDADGRLVGMLSRTDLLRAIAADYPNAAPETPSPALARVVADVMMADVPAVELTASPAEVLAGILASPYRRVVVIDQDRRVRGIITDRSLLARADPAARPGLLARLAGWASSAPSPASEPATAATLMEDQVFTIPADATVADAVRELLAHLVKRLVVVDAEGRLAGILDRRALLRTLVSQADACGATDESDRPQPSRVAPEPSQPTG